MSKNPSIACAAVLAPAKINLYLRVLGKRPDGYHDIDSLMFPVSLHDEIRISVEPATRPVVTCRVSGPERVAGGTSNLAARAASMLLERWELNRRVTIALRKVIPHGAGLGGGSSDAATVLRVLPRLLGKTLRPEHAERMAARLGADVAFFIRCRPARARGIGDELSALARVPAGAAVIVVPPARVDTAWAYRSALDGLTSARSVSNLAPLPRRLDAVESWFFNDFARGVERAVPAVQVCRRRLARLGARATVLSGSGSAVVGWFEDMATAREAAGKFALPDKAFAVTILSKAPRAAITLAKA